MDSLANQPPHSPAKNACLWSKEYQFNLGCPHYIAKNLKLAP